MQPHSEQNVPLDSIAVVVLLLGVTSVEFSGCEKLPNRQKTSHNIQRGYFEKRHKKMNV